MGEDNMLSVKIKHWRVPPRPDPCQSICSCCSAAATSSLKEHALAKQVLTGGRNLPSLHCINNEYIFFSLFGQLQRAWGTQKYHRLCGLENLTIIGHSVISKNCGIPVQRIQNSGDLKVSSGNKDWTFNLAENMKNMTYEFFARHKP